MALEQLRLYPPVKPFTVIQRFGGNADYYARFRGSDGKPLKGHNGIDVVASHGTPIYAPCDGMAHWEIDPHHGEGIIIHTGVHDYKGRPTTFNVLNWHICSKDDPLLKPKIPADGNLYPVKTGDLIAYADNTGAPFESSGDHDHIGLIPFDETLALTEPNNGFDGRINPLPYFTNIYAQDVPSNITLLRKQVADLTAKLVALFNGRLTSK